MLDIECLFNWDIALRWIMNMSKVGIGMFLNTYRQKKRGEKFIAVCGMDFEEI